jgi:serine protease
MNITKLASNSFMLPKLSLPALLILLLIVGCSKADNQPEPPPPPMPPKNGIYQNGQLSTGAVSNSGVSAPAGTLWSELQNEVNNQRNVILGFSCHWGTIANYKLADDFTVTAGETWDVKKISVYAMADASATLSPFDALRLQIWKGKPSDAGSTLIYGDLLTNVLSASIDSLRYVIASSSLPSINPSPATNLKVWKLTANINTKLGAGTYWLLWQVHTASGREAYTPPIKVKGSRGLAGWNAIVYNASNVWQNVFDTGAPSLLPAVPQDLPFEVEYNY